MAFSQGFFINRGQVYIFELVIYFGTSEVTLDFACTDAIN